MRLLLTPQRSELSAKYYADTALLTVEVGGDIDTFDFTDAPDGEFDGFASDTLPLCPILRAEKSGDALTVWALGWYGPRPERAMQHTPVTDDAGEIIDYRPEPEADYEARLAEWQALTQEREIQL
ncbi:hypothetical protein EVC62_02090 [Salinicola endophyticus]|uniref:Uncharacterized protein n=1 Tax=Salinicola endophyticus TaxID=1949083 RepID=A0ABY8FC42_9GAMM|nr:hypothetical protein [Salinicola endophyticus]WFF40384.1 hypothetical protein EVC62_02090 [Salinicola endophyticus]